jgi:hypothetical protein
MAELIDESLEAYGIKSRDRARELVDPGHAPARRTYEAAGFRIFPVARYFKKL